MDNRIENAASAQVNIVYQNGDIRISAITPRLIRIEKGAYTDLPSQTVFYRDFGKVSFHWSISGTQGTLETAEASFLINLQRGTLVSAKLADGSVIKDFRKGILPGTARTLDMINGATKLEKGILSRSGGSMLDDSKSLLLENDEIIPRKKSRDIYYFAYGKDLLGQLKDYFRLTGPVPLIPKFALGNWWSRYKAYTQEEYRQLMQTFIDRKIPITVATIDMDWHWVNVKTKFGKIADPGKPRTLQEIMYNFLLPGWTGYSWNTELFPDHKALLRWLHEQGFKVPLNVHPSQGIRPYEDCYESFCRSMGIDPASKKRIPFEITDNKFRDTYFREAHRPLEADGVDFWWIDWQQGKLTDVPGLDPLWALNHYHIADMEKQGKRPLILSRYAGLGSHRYPLGFSGDTFCTWKSLAFQPYFTSTAANAGYSWWSHDIGGHQQGIQDEELYLRWIQFGVFSPINRLHSSNSDFMGKEPWQHSWAVCHIAEEFMRLRHKLVPYLYSANYATHTEGTPLCMPMYYTYNEPEAWKAKNQYMFGSELLVCPITRPTHKRLHLSYCDVWLPKGRWTDIFNGRSYQGGKWIRMHRDLDSIPVLAKEGAIVPMYQKGESNSLSANQSLDIHVWQGTGTYRMYEDDGETTKYASGEYAITRFEIQKTNDGYLFRIDPPVDTFGILPTKRIIRICFRDIVAAKIDLSLTASLDNGYFTVETEVGSSPIVFQLTDIKSTQNPDKQILRSALMTRYQGSNLTKSVRFRRATTIPGALKGALKEFDFLT